MFIPERKWGLQEFGNCRGVEDITFETLDLSMGEKIIYAIWENHNLIKEKLLLLANFYRCKTLDMKTVSHSYKIQRRTIRA